MEQARATKEFAVGQKYRIKRRGEWAIVRRTKCFVTIESGFNVYRCKVRTTRDGEEYIEVPRIDVLGRTDMVRASEAIVSETDTVEVKAPKTTSEVEPKTKTPKEETTMTKVERIVEAVKAAGTEAAIVSALIECTKKELHAVLLAVCGEKAKKAPNSWKNAEIVCSYARRIMEHRERNAFRALSFEEKYEYLTDATRSHHSMTNVLFAMTWDEVQQLCKRLGVDPEMDREYLPMALTSKLRVHVQANHIETLAADDEPDGLGELIDHANFGTIEILCAKHGITLEGGVDNKSALDRRTLRQALYNFYLGDMEYESPSLHSEYAI